MQFILSLPSDSQITFWSCMKYTPQEVMRQLCQQMAAMTKWDPVFFPAYDEEEETGTI